MEKPIPKARFSLRTTTGDHLTFVIWPAKKDPAAEVLTIQISRHEGPTWTLLDQLVVYRNKKEEYSRVPGIFPRQLDPKHIERLVE